MKHRRIGIIFVAMLTLVVGSCGDKEKHLNVSESQIQGLWVESGTQVYWRYSTGGSGVTWDASQDISEDESNLTFIWTINGDVLTHVFTGQQANQAVSKVYTVTEISSTSMVWEDDYGSTCTLLKQ